MGHCMYIRFKGDANIRAVGQRLSTCVPPAMMKRELMTKKCSFVTPAQGDCVLLSMLDHIVLH